MARARSRLGQNGSEALSAASSRLKPSVQSGLVSAALNLRLDLAAGLNSSRTLTPRGFRARGFRCISTSSGTITVRDQ